MPFDYIVQEHGRRGKQNDNAQLLYEALSQQFRPTGHAVKIGTAIKAKVTDNHQVSPVRLWKAQVTAKIENVSMLLSAEIQQNARIFRGHHFHLGGLNVGLVFRCRPQAPPIFTRTGSTVAPFHLCSTSVFPVTQSSGATMYCFHKWWTSTYAVSSLTISPRFKSCLYLLFPSTCLCCRSVFAKSQVKR